MQVWQTVSSMRQRARNAEITTQKVQLELKQKLVKRTYDQMGAFEEYHRHLKEKTARDELEEEVELARLSEGWTRARAMQLERQLAQKLPDNHSESSSIKSGTTNPLLRASHSESTLASRHYLDRSEVLHSYRPPSPLHFHDYGQISVRPRSQQQQRRNPGGEPSRPAYRQEFCGVYFPGPDYKQGPYGSSMIDPIMMPPMHWQKCQQPPDRYKDAADMRPRTAEGRDRPAKGGFAEAMLAQHEESKEKTFVRSTRAHETMTKHRKDVAKKKDQEAFIENVRFEQGQFEGRFANPMAKNSGWSNEEMINEVKKIESPAPRLAWDAQGGGLGALGKRIFLSLSSVMRKRRANLKHLFKYVNHGVPGILEPSEFLEGLQRLGIVEQGECSAQTMADLMYDLDPNFDGRVALSEVNRCVQATRAICGLKGYKAHLNLKGSSGLLEPTNIYSERLPVEMVKVERQPKSLWDFECSFQQLREQQHALQQVFHD